LICYPFEHNNEIVAAVYQTNVVLYNLHSRRLEFCMKDLSFSPTAMASACGYLAVGGQRSQIVVKNLQNDDYIAQTSVGGAINNALHISRHLDEDRLLICNNDETIKIFSLPTLDHIEDIRLRSAVNSGNLIFLC
jgi:hypothetical protein